MTCHTAGEGAVEPQTVADRFDAAAHPDVVAGKTSADEVRALPASLGCAFVVGRGSFLFVVV